ncbi:MAG: DUF2339 domain-containing protein [Flavobacterium sp.]|uniref:DUF2339 domain-containing protein n=1 Tax=Flavobacterium sp. TaxID=239 RepID=UPI00121AA712|nr:DUF2339 domain-containing protein [Flavobacterium sp.]RZJ67043.1 MAG: DUF2339 domain-containing protein [Flavobacterium sp.]
MEIFLLIVVVAIVLFGNSSLGNKITRLEERLREMQRTMDYLKSHSGEKPQDVEKITPKPVETPVTRPEPTPEPKAVIVPEIPKPEPKIEVEQEKIPEKETVSTPERVAAFAMDRPAQPTPAPKPYVPEKDWWERFKEKNPDLEKFIGENLINKIGILILVLGISYFVKYAIDKDWINEPARVGIGILAGALVMGVAHRLRKNYAPFSSVLVAGAISIFYFTIGIAFHDYKLFSQSVAFGIMVGITAFSAFVSLSYNRMELAILSLIGGFAVPFMVSTGEGNYVVLFTYILILDIGILAMAYHRKWLPVNIIAFAFTMLLFAGWLKGDLIIEKPHYAGALGFAFAFYLTFIAINIINNIRQKGAFSISELSVISINTFLFYGVGMIVLNDWHPELKGLFTAALSILNLIYATVLYKKFGADKTTVYLLIGLTLTFITLAVPIQFKGNNITLFWAAEAVLLMWLGQKSGFVSYRFASAVVHFLMLVSLVMDWNNGYLSDKPIEMIVLNPIFITSIFAMLTMGAVTWLLLSEEENVSQFGFIFNPTQYRTYTLIVCFAIGYLSGLFETAYQSYKYIANENSAAALPITWHLLASFGLFVWFSKKSGVVLQQFANILACLNIAMLVFWFSRFPFREHLEYIASGDYSRLAFFLHYLWLAILIGFGIGLYRTNKDDAKSFFTEPAALWICAFLVIFVSSSELLLHTYLFSNTPVTAADYNEIFIAIYGNDIDGIKFATAEEVIANVRTQVIKSGFPILWGVLAFAFLIVGIKRKARMLRIVSLVLLGITIVKLFVYDIRNASETGKIIAFILLGVVILVISFVYQKLKVLVLDDPNSKKDENPA